MAPRRHGVSVRRGIELLLILLALGRAMDARGDPFPNSVGSAPSVEAAPLLTEPSESPCDGGDEIWLVTTRGLGPRPCWGCRHQATLCYRRWNPCAGWEAASCDEYFAGQCRFAATIVHVHGNRIEDADACDQGLMLYRRLRACRPCSGPIRLVVWSWPSEAIPASWLLFRDVRVKYRRTAAQSYLLADWLSHADRDVPISLIGYSFGARIILGAAHLLGGGTLDGRQLPRQGCYPRCVQVALWAAATENAFLVEGGRHECAMRVIDRVLITVNRHDPALKRFRRVICRARQRALGYTGIRGTSRLRPRVLRLCGETWICEIDVTRIVGYRHAWKKYVASNFILAETARLAMPRPR